RHDQGRDGQRFRILPADNRAEQVRAIQDRARALRPTGPPDAADAMGNAPSAAPATTDRELEDLMELEHVAPEEFPDRSGRPPDPVERLQKLADLHDRGALTDAEFAVEKARILSQ